MTVFKVSRNTRNCATSSKRQANIIISTNQSRPVEGCVGSVLRDWALVWSVGGGHPNHEEDLRLDDAHREVRLPRREALLGHRRDQPDEHTGLAAAAVVVRVLQVGRERPNA